MDRIETDRLVLRRARMDDLAAMHRVLSDPRAMRYWSSLPHVTEAQTREWLEDMIATPAFERDDFVIELQGLVIGKAGFWRLPEVGFILHPDHWGRGYAREALTAVLERAFSRHGMPAITADVDPRNSASLKLLKALGFAETGRARRTWLIGQEWCDSIYLRLDREGWPASARPLMSL